MRTKKETIETAALELRVFARRTGHPVTRDMAWNAIAARQLPGDPAVSATDVLRVARRELRANEEGHLA